MASEVTPIAAPGVSVEIEAIRNLLDTIHAGRFVPLANSEGLCQSVLDNAESALTALLASAAGGEPIGEGFFLPDGSWSGSASRTPGYLRMVEDDEANGCTIRPLYAQPPTPELADHEPGLLRNILQTWGFDPEQPQTIKDVLAKMHTYSPPAPVGAPQVVPDGVWEALQRLIENGGSLGPASQEDALLVAKHRQFLMTTRVVTGALPAPNEDNPSKLPASLGATVREALQTGFQARGYRTDGDDLALARRAHLMALEDRDLIGMQKALNVALGKKLDSLAATPAGAVPSSPVAVCDVAKISTALLRLDTLYVDLIDDVVFTRPDWLQKAINCVRGIANKSTAPQDAAPSAVPVEQTGEKKLYIVMNEQGSEGVVFDDKKDAEWTKTGDGYGSSGFGSSPCIGEDFRESYGDGKLTLHEVSASILSALPLSGGVQGDAARDVLRGFEANKALTQLRFFRDLAERQRIDLFSQFKAVPAGAENEVNSHTIEHTLFNFVWTSPRRDEFASAIDAAIASQQDGGRGG